MSGFETSLRRERCRVSGPVTGLRDGPTGGRGPTSMSTGTAEWYMSFFPFYSSF